MRRGDAGGGGVEGRLSGEGQGVMRTVHPSPMSDNEPALTTATFPLSRERSFLPRRGTEVSSRSRITLSLSDARISRFRLAPINRGEGGSPAGEIVGESKKRY